MIVEAKSSPFHPLFLQNREQDPTNPLALGRIHLPTVRSSDLSLEFQFDRDLVIELELFKV